MKHTPAPWSFVITSKEDVGAILNANKDHVCDFGYAEPYDNWFGTAPKKEDLDLILAAPELLEALQNLTSMYVDFINSGDAGNWNPEEEKEIIAARAAIAKATGAE